ncbi:MAG: hypothetical protein NTW87_30900 [Planctomycetota bacterium]|nr:hypothetical protein [Planctomycetota bacterium]
MTTGLEQKGRPRPMTRLRTLAQVALAALLFAGLTGCANRPGDLGAAREEEAPVVKTAPKDGGPAAEVVDVDKPAAKEAVAQTVPPADSKEAPAELVSLQPAPLVEVTPATAARPGELAAGETKADETKPKEGETPPPGETPQQRAARLLKDAERLAGVKVQETMQESEAAYQAGLKLFTDLEYEQARRYFEKAVLLNAANDAAQQKLRTCNALLGVHINIMREKIKELEEAERVKAQETMAEMARALEEARILEERGTGAALEPDVADKERVLAEQMDALRRAQDRYRRVRAIINWLPPSIELPALRTQVDTALGRIRQKLTDKDDEMSFLRRQEAAKLAADARERETDQFKQRVKKLLEQVKDLCDRLDYRGAERLAIRVLQMDPLNTEAEGWKSKARSAYHANEDAAIGDLKTEEYKKSWEAVDEAAISYARDIQYPANWDQITARRTEATAIGRQVKEEAWKADIKKKLQRKVTFEFVDTPLDEAISFLRQLANVTMIVDPKVLAGGAPTINLRVTDMGLDLALEWILKLADLEYALRDNAIFISKPANLTESVELRIYDVSDLTQNIQDFPGPDIQVAVVGDATGGGGGGGAGGAGGAGGFQPVPKVAPTLTNIADMIRNRVRPESWDAALGTSIEERAGRLVVMQRPEVHALIDQLLSNFRATQKMMVNIEARFLTIREAYLEDIGVEFQGLDPNVLYGDFGDIRRLGAPTGLVQPRVPAGSDATPPNAPFPGIVNPYNRTLGGTISEVGSIVNHAVNFFPNDPDTISGNDTANTVRQGGLSAQMTILNNAQVQAFVRALAVRENTSTLVAPRLTVFNTQRAHMFVARQQSYVSDYEISGDSYDPVIRQFLVGVVLDVKPIVSSDRRYVTLEMRPTVTELVNFQTRQINTYSVNSGANVNVFVQLAFPIQFPELSIRRVRTTATVPDGGILMLGGLYRNVQFHSENGVPFLSDLPVVGRLFRWNTVDNAKSNLAILVSPRIILFSEEEEKL